MFQLIRINEPDLVLFVGEALVGNEAVDQLVKFNQVWRSSFVVSLKLKLHFLDVTCLFVCLFHHIV